MPHGRKNIRDATKTLLLNNTVAGSHVYTNRSEAYWESELPAVCIMNGPETAEPRGMKTRESYRTFNLQIEVRVQENDTVDDAVDALCLQIEDIIKASPNLTNTAVSVIYRGTEPRYNAEGQREIGFAVLNYEVKYNQ